MSDPGIVPAQGREARAPLVSVAALVAWRRREPVAHASMAALAPHPRLSVEVRRAILASARRAREVAAALRTHLPEILTRAAQLHRAAHEQRLRTQAQRRTATASRGSAP